MPTKKPPKIRVVKGYGRYADQPLLAAGSAAVEGLDANTDLPNPPFPASVLKPEVIKLGELIGANDGGKKAIADKNKQKAVVVKMLEQDAHYVEVTANNDPNIIGKSGFQMITAKTPPQPLPQPRIDKIVAGPNSGQLLVAVLAILKARMFDLRYGVSGPNGQLPTVWTNEPFPSVKPPMAITGLTPGTSYTFQVRAYGTLGYTDYSEPVTKIAT